MKFTDEYDPWLLFGTNDPFIDDLSGESGRKNMNELPEGVTPDMFIEVDYGSYTTLAIASKVDWARVKRFRVFVG